MRIAIINHGVFPYLLGGMERHTHFLATHLSRIGAHVDVVVPELTAQQSADFTLQGNPYGLIQCPWPPAPVWLMANYRYSHSAIEPLTRNGYDAVYCQGFNALAYLREVPKRDRALTLLNMHGMEMFKTVSAWQTLKTTHMRLAAKYQVKLADRVISSGGRLTEETSRFLSVGKDRIDVIPNGVDPDHIDRIAPAALHSSERPQFVFIGRLAENKGVHVLCQAFKGIEEADLTIIGTGPLEADLRSRFARGNVRFVGALGDVEMFGQLKSADCFVFASLYEGMPTVILEAMVCGRPVIATDIGAVKTMVGDDNGFVVEPGAVDQLRQAIEAFLALPQAEQRRRGEASRAKVARLFAWPLVARQTLDVIERHLSGAR